MNYQVFRLLEREELETVMSYVSQQQFVDGKITAQGLASEVKHNLQIPRSAPELSEADNILISALRRNREYQRFVYPKSSTLPTFSRYDPGMKYGSHIDDSIMKNRSGETMRTDFSLTVFLSPADSYDGGELVVELPGGEQEIKLDAGEAVAYSSSSIHHVNPVTRGVRLAAIMWVQSIVRDDQARTILCDLSQAVVKAKDSGDRDLSLLINKSFHNLLRYVSEP
jgi:PKHD-type hydroxylase